MTNQIEKEFLLLVEGKDEVEFFEAVIFHMGFSNIGVRAVGGKDQFRHQFPVFLNDPNFSLLKGYGIIRDADQDANAAFESIANLLRKWEQPVPSKSEDFALSERIKTGIYIMPGDSQTGMLETLE